MLYWGVAAQGATSFGCTKCGACCRSVGKVPESIRGSVIIPDRNGACIHLKQDNTCDIYEIRPKICRVDALKPPLVPTRLWYRLNLIMCDRLHMNVYGTSRPVEG